VLLVCFDRSALEATLPTVRLQLSLTLVVFHSCRTHCENPCPPFLVWWDRRTYISIGYRFSSVLFANSLSILRERYVNRNAVIT
jgi:hypothetical protein